MYTRLKERQFYEDIYDRHTVEGGRRGMVHYDKFYADFESKLPKDEKIDRPGNAFLLNVFYMETVGNELLARYEKRDQYITEWMAKDEAKDDQIASARLTEEPRCHHCGKQRLRITDKSFMHRGEHHKHDDPEEVLFILNCPHCDKNSAFWEDGTAWKVKPTLCPKCKSEVTHKTTKTKQAITFTYTCPSCKHSYKEKMDLRDKKEAPDPDYDKDRIHYCLIDEEFRDRLSKMRRDFIEMARLGKEFKEKEDNKHIYDAVKEMKKPKIAELVPLLSPVLEKASYIEFHLDKLDWLGKDFSTHSLVYGWNGTGKTTLSNILYCLENKEICIDDFDTVQFKLDTQSAGTVTHKDISSNSLKLRVFNEQFINANVHFDGTGSNPIVMIGDSNIKLLEEIESDTKKLESDKGVLLELQEERKKAVDTEEILSNAARKWRQIATDLSATGDKYFGSSFKITQVKNLLSDCKVTHENVNELTIDAQAEVDAKKSIGSVWQKIEFEATEDIDLTRIFDRANKLLGGHVSVKKLADVENLEKPVKEWVEQGVAYHKETDICAFCSNHISTTRLEDLAAQFTDLLADAHSQIDELIQEINSLSFDPLDVDSSKIMPAEQKIFSECKQSMDDSSKRLSSELIKLKGLLVEKKSYITDQTKTYEPVEYPIKDLKAYNTAVSELSASIERNNTLVDNIEEENQANLSILMLNCISKELVTEKYFDNVELNLELDEKISALKEAVEVDAIALEKKKETINDQKKAVEKINGLLSNFFDNKRIQFKPVEVEGITTYQIIRNQKVAKNLSEGEKSVLALAYFLVSLSSSSSNELQNTTVIIDDPVDSQDSNFLFRTYGVIKRCTKDAKQLVIMTHNYEFFNLVRDWFSNTTAIDKSLLLIERNMGQSGEEVKISNLPTLLADYKTEYHYLFSKLYGFAYKNEAIDSPMVANIARKTLEYFSSFKWCCKDSVDFGNRIQSKFLKDDATPDERAVGDAIYKFVNEYSHALDPFRPVNITDSEARDTATNALKFIQKSDPEHYKVLKKQCDKHYEMSRS